MADYRKLARRAALKHGIDPGTFERQIGAESGVQPARPLARGRARHRPDHARHRRGPGASTPTTRSAVSNGAARLMAQLACSKYGSYRDALVAYNAGPGRVGKCAARRDPGLHRQDPRRSRAQPKPVAPGRLRWPARWRRRRPPRPRARHGEAGARQPARQPGPERAQQSAVRYWPALDRPPAADGQARCWPTRAGTGPAVPAPRCGGLRGARARLTGWSPSRASKVAAWIAPALSYARKHGWKGAVTSGFRTDAEQKRIYDSGVRPAAVPEGLRRQGLQS
jgi:hypothetical protein